MSQGQQSDRITYSSVVYGERRGQCVVVTLDNPPVNAISADLRAGIMAALADVRSKPDVTAVVLTGAGKTFVGGADIKEFGKPPAEPTLPDVIAAIEGMDKPVVAAINGAALGGGLELALACHVRIAAPSATLGMPEVNLGLVPGAGGTQRLPRLVGPVTALEMITDGKPVPARAALASGLIDGIAEDDLVEHAVALALDHAAKPLRRTGTLPVPTYEGSAFEAAASRVLKKARGRSAPAEAIRLVRLATEVPLADGLREERATFIRLRDSEESTALRHIFFAERAAGKLAGPDADATPRDILRVGIAGTGLMGCGIAVAALTAGYWVIALDQTAEAAEKGAARIKDMIGQSVKSGRISEEVASQQIARLAATADPRDLADTDMVIEAVFDDLDVKVTLFQQLDGIVRKDTILATNTSYLNPDDIAARTAVPHRVVGLHFFSPANIMRLVEVVRLAKTEADVLATTLAFARKLKKLPVISGVCEGFIGNRIYSAYRSEGERLLEEGALPQDVDRALEAYGFPMGLFAVNDMAGLEIAWARRKRQAATRDPTAPYFEIPDRLCEAGRFGRKTGKGWYLYEDGARRVDPEIDAMIAAYRVEKGLVARELSDAEIVDRLLAAMAREGDALLAEGIAASASDIDVVMINGYGFPAHRGGPMFARDRKHKAGTAQ
ncbi:3-hydroxyacyl-CoA dehydrogenase [Rhizobium sp. RU36D]|nr:3-hydroxyacyl-CoA dehydrogenase [Rhizobium sp. RU36D]